MKGKRIAIVGSGSIGLFYGGKLAAQGHDVRFLLRSGYEEAASKGLRIYSQTGDVHLTRPAIFRTAAEIGAADLVIVSLKTTSNAALEHLLAPLLHESTMVLTLQNGLGNEEYLSDLAGHDKILGGLCFVCLTRRTFASVDHIGHGTLSIGEHGRKPSERTIRVVEAFREAGIETRMVDDLANERWRKLVWNVPFNGLSVAGGGVTTDRILSDPALHAEARALMEEIIATANALGYPIEAEYADFQINRTPAMGPYKPSTMVDWQNGHKLEIEPIWGEPLRRAKAAGVPVPHLEKLYLRLKAI